MTLPSTKPVLTRVRATFALERIDGMTCVVITYPDRGTSDIVRPNDADYGAMKRQAELQAAKG